MNQASKHAVLRRRAQLLRGVRNFFEERGLLEVETPLLSAAVIPELHIEPFAVPPSAGVGDRLHADTDYLWLQASPELHMKRMLVDGVGDVFQITKSFRRGERGRLHRPEFTLVEWYRTGDDMHQGMNLLEELVQSLLPTPPVRRTTYAEAFFTYVGVDPHTASADELAGAARAHNVAAPVDIPQQDRDEWLNLLLSAKVEERLGRDGPEMLFEYPASQASLAKVRTRRDGVAVAERFELYWQGVELANGYNELTDADELRRRLEEVNAGRRADGRMPLPMPEPLLAAMQAGLPDCAGCALGFDRFVMLSCELNSIHEATMFPTD